MTNRERFLVHCMSFHGIPYLWGGEDPKKGLDCSGLVQHLLSYLKLDPPGDQTAHDLKNYFTQNGVLVIDYMNAGLGCLCFYGSPSKITHVSMVLGDGLMIEAGGGGSKTTSVEIAMKQGAKVRIRPINQRSDLVCVIEPKGLTW